MKVGIIGGGIMGCTLGYHLALAGHKVHIFEAGSQVGGLSTWFDFGDFVWDKYYHVILKSDEHLLNLIDTLGLSDKLYWANTKTGFLWQDQHTSLSNYWEFITFPALNIFQKTRLAAGIIYNSLVTDPSHLAEKTAKEWLTVVYGKTVYQTIWEPLLESKFGTLSEVVPAAIIWSSLKRYSSTRSKKSGVESMGHLQGGGLKVLFDALVRGITVHGGKISTGKMVTEIDYQQGHPIIVDCGNEKFTCDRLINTIPTALLRRMAPQLPEIYSSLPAPKYLGLIRLALILKESLSPYYITNLIDRGLPFTGIIEVSRLGRKEEFKNHAFVMIPRYDVPDSSWFHKSDEDIKHIFIEYLKRTWPDIEDNICASYVHREKIVQALWIETPPPRDTPSRTKDNRIWNINNELAGFSTLNNNSLVGVVDNAMIEWTKSTPPPMLSS